MPFSWWFIARLILIYFRHRRELNIGASSNAVSDGHNFVRLLLLGLLDVFTTLPYVICGLVTDLQSINSIKFWPGWHASHTKISTIVTLSAEEWRSAGAFSLFFTIYNQWIGAVYALAFFCLYGLTDHRRAWYRNVFRKLLELLGVKSLGDKEASNILFLSNPTENFFTLNGTTGAEKWAPLEINLLVIEWTEHSHHREDEPSEMNGSDSNNTIAPFENAMQAETGPAHWHARISWARLSRIIHDR